MGKFWLNLVIIAFVVVGILVGWDLYVSYNGLKGEFDEEVTSIEPTLYQGVESHFREGQGI